MATRIAGVARITPPWEPTPALPVEIASIKALMAGKASEHQQGVFIEWLKRASGVGELEFRPDSERASAFASGKRFVAMQFFSLAFSQSVNAAPTKDTL